MSAETVPVAPPAPQTSRISARISVEEYMELERTADTRHEYVNGEVIAMAGETLQHNRIARNISLQLEAAFGKRPCETFIENIRVRVSPTQYRYPDVVALCGEPVVDANRPPVLLNPAVIIEVLSPSTEQYDRDGKFMEYRQIATLTDYVLVEQDSSLVVHYARLSPTEWIVREYSDLTNRITFVALEVSITLAQIYRKITW